MSGAIAQVGRQLSGAAQQVPTEQLVAAKHRVDELIVVFDEATSQSQNPDVVAALARLRHASTTLGQALERAQRIVGALSALADQWGLTPIRRTVSTPPAPEPQTRPAGAGLGPPAPGSPPPQAAPVEAAEGFRRAPNHIAPGFVADMARDAHVPPGAKTAGILSDGTGARLHKGVLVNGARGAVVNNRETLLPQWHRLDVALTHVEGHTSAIMRDRRIDHAVLVVTRRPCKGDLGCHAQLAGLLDEGATIDVYVAHGDNAVYWGTYTGTGEGATRR